MNWHLLKTNPEHFDAILSGTKTCEVRINDRDYQLGDVLVLREWGTWRGPVETHDYSGDYSGRVAIYEVTHCTYTKDLTARDTPRFGPEWAVMSIKPWDSNIDDSSFIAFLHSDQTTQLNDELESRSGTPFKPGCQ